MLQDVPAWLRPSSNEVAREYGFIDVREEPSTLGANVTDFNALMSTDPNLGDPHFQAAWFDVKKQLVAEGTKEFTGAKLAMTTAFYGVIEKGFGVTPQDAALAAKKFVLIGQTVLGQVGVIQNLLAQAQGKLTTEQEVQLGQAFVGTMIGMAAALAPETAGIGAVIVAAIAIAMVLLKNAGMFGKSETPANGWLPNDVGQPPQPMEQKPDYTIGGLGAWAANIAPAAANWRQFPKYGTPANPIAENAAWFLFPTSLANFKAGPGKWKDGFFGIRKPGADQTCDNPQGFFNIRPIDFAFPDFRTFVDPNNWGDDPKLIMDHLGIPHGTPTGDDFGNVFISAWRANAEYDLNGLRSQSRSDLLIHMLRVWNHVHAISMVGPGQRHTLNASAALVVEAKNILSINDSLYAPNGSLFINLGPRATPPVTVDMTGIVGAGARDTSQDATPEAQYRAQLAADAAQQAAAAAPLIPTPIKVVGGTAIVAGGAWLALGRPMTIAAAKAAARALYRSVVHR
jgi:hypothetical protein